MINRDSRLFSHTWYVATRKAKKGSILTDRQSEFKIQRNPIRYWVADPFVFDNDGKTYIFAEMKDYIRQRGIIGVCEYNDGKISRWKPVLIEPFHLSYPFVFKIGGEKDIFMIPETYQAKELRVYKAEQFPNKWKLYKTLAQGRSLVDTTLYEDEVLKGFTMEIGENGQSYVVKIDKNFERIDLTCEKDSKAETFRNGGQIFRYGDKLVRVCQDCIAVYGNGLIFRELNEDNTSSEMAHIMPENLKFDRQILLKGIHTYSATDEVEVIDVRTRTFDFLNLFFRVLKKAKGMICKKKSHL